MFHRLVTSPILSRYQSKFLARFFQPFRLTDSLNPKHNFFRRSVALPIRSFSPSLALAICSVSSSCLSFVDGAVVPDIDVRVYLIYLHNYGAQFVVAFMIYLHVGYVTGLYLTGALLVSLVRCWRGCFQSSTFVYLLPL